MTSSIWFKNSDSELLEGAERPKARYHPATTHVIQQGRAAGPEISQTTDPIILQNARHLDLGFPNSVAGVADWLVVKW